MSKLPTVAIIGQANVGKSSLFNRLTRSRTAIVAREAGTTRDNVVGKVSYKRRNVDSTPSDDYSQFWLIDTAGLKTAEDEFEATIQDQIADASAAADVILVTVDSTVYPSDANRQLAKKALKSGKPVILIANKADLKGSLSIDEFKRLGIKNIIKTSAEHSIGISELLDSIAELIPPATETTPDDIIRVAPIINPITIISTITAFSFDTRMIWWRIIFALIIVQITAFIVSFFKEDSVINPEFEKLCHYHNHDSKLSNLFGSSRNEFWQLFTMLVLGASIAAATQIFVPRFIINAVGGDIFLSVISMITLSFVISICSSIDAFFALAYVRNFTTGSILSFLLFGPMIDIKMITLLKTTFRWKFIATITLIVFILSLIVGLGVNLYVR